MSTTRFKWGECDEDGWPLVWPWLTAGDFCEYTMQDDDGRNCMNGALHRLFMGNAWAFRDENDRATAWLLKRRQAVVLPTLAALSRIVGFDASTRKLIHWNNTARRKDRARAWRELGKRLGYTGNYTLREAKR